MHTIYENMYLHVIRNIWQYAPYSVAQIYVNSTKGGARGFWARNRATASEREIPQTTPPPERRQNMLYYTIHHIRNVWRSQFRKQYYRSFRSPYARHELEHTTY